MNSITRDENGIIVPYDDPNIKNDEALIRYFSKDHIVRDDKAPNGYRLSSGTFSPSSEPHHGISVDLENQMLQDGLPSEGQCSPENGAVRVLASIPREESLMVGTSPMEGNPYHAEIWGREGV
ncbi:hypothetical protein [Fodinicurvata halophila]|uniref:hypothetical protein n=1 Tax=Fodinicurvata halophila TaxID=1419723 RepID=UPI003634F627